MTTDELLGELTSTYDESNAAQQSLIEEKQRKLAERTDSKLSKLELLSQQGFNDAEESIITSDMIRPIDGDTFVVSTENGDSTIRVLGVDTYESTKDNYDEWIANPNMRAKMDKQRARLAAEKGLSVDDVNDTDVFVEGDRQKHVFDTYMNGPTPAKFKFVQLRNDGTKTFTTNDGVEHPINYGRDLGGLELAEDWIDGNGVVHKAGSSIYNTNYNEAITSNFAHRNNKYDGGGHGFFDTFEVNDAYANSYVENAAKAAVTGISGSLYGMADTVTELAGSALSSATGGAIGDTWDLGTEDERSKAVSAWVGYDDTRSAKSMGIIADEAKKMWDEGKLDGGSLWTIAKTAFSDADTFMYSLGTLATWVVGGEFGAAAKGAKALKVAKTARAAGDIEKATKYLNKAKAYRATTQELGVATKFASKAANLYTKDAGFNTAVLSATNDDIDEFKKNNGGEIAMDDIARIALVNYASLGLDKFTGLRLMKLDPVAVEGFRSIGRAIGEKGREVLGKKLTDMATAGTKESIKLVGAMGVEGAQEYVQTMSELFNVQYGTEKYGSSVNKILTDDSNIIESLTAASAGAAGGAQFKSIGLGKAGFVAAGKELTGNIGKFNENETSFSTDLSKEAARNASIEDLKKVTEYEAQRAYSKVYLNDVVEATKDGDGNLWDENVVASSIKNTIDKLVAVNSIQTDAGKSGVAARVIKEIIDKNPNVGKDKLSNAVKQVTVGMKEEQKLFVYERMVTDILERAANRSNDSMAKNSAIKMSAGETSLVDERTLKEAKAAVKEIRELGSSFEEGSQSSKYFDEVANGLEDKIDSIGQGKSKIDIDTEIFDTGFNLVGKFGTVHYKSMKEHASDILMELSTSIDAKHSTSLDSLEGFVNSRGATAVRATGAKGKKFSESEQVNLANTRLGSNEGIRETINSLKVLALSESVGSSNRAGYVARLDKMLSVLDAKDKELTEKITKLGGKVKPKNRSTVTPKKASTKEPVEDSIFSDIDIPGNNEEVTIMDIDGNSIIEAEKEIVQSNNKVESTSIEGYKAELAKLMALDVNDVEAYDKQFEIVSKLKEALRSPSKQVNNAQKVDSIFNDDYKESEAITEEGSKGRKSVKLSSSDAKSINGVKEFNSNEVLEAITESAKNIAMFKVRTEKDLNTYKSMIKEHNELVSGVKKKYVKKVAAKVRKEIRLLANNTDSEKINREKAIKRIKLEAYNEVQDIAAKIKIEEETIKDMVRLAQLVTNPRSNKEAIKKVKDRIAEKNTNTGKILQERRIRKQTNSKVIESKIDIGVETMSPELITISKEMDGIRDDINEISSLVDYEYKKKFLFKQKTRDSLQKQIASLKKELADIDNLRTSEKVNDNAFKIIDAVFGVAGKVKTMLKIIKAEIQSKWNELEDRFDRIDKVFSSRIRKLEKIRNGLVEQVRDKEVVRKELVGDILAKNSPYAEIVKNSKLANEALDRKKSIKVGLFNRAMGIKTFFTGGNSINGVKNLLDLDILPRRLQKDGKAGLKLFEDGEVVDNDSAFIRLYKNTQFIHKWVNTSTGLAIQDAVIRIGENPSFSKLDSDIISNATVTLLANDNGVKRLALVDKDGKEVKLDGAEYKVNPLHLIMRPVNGGKKLVSSSTKLEDVVNVVSLQVATDIKDTRYLSSSEMEQFIDGAFGVKPMDPLYEMLSKMLRSGVLPEASFIQSAGKAVLKQLDIKVSENLSIDDKNALVSALGQLVIEQIKSNKIAGFKANQQSNIKVGDDNIVSKFSSIAFYKDSNGMTAAEHKKLVDAAFKQAPGREFRMLTISVEDDTGVEMSSAANMLEYIGVNGNKVGAMAVPGGNHKVGEMLIRKTNTLADEKDVEYVNSQEKMPRTFNRNFKLLLSNFGTDRSKWNNGLLESWDDIGKLPAMEREIAIINRRAGEREIDGMLETYELLGDNEFFLKWDMTSSDRYMIDSNVINPQNGKISRFLIGLDGMRSTMRWGENGFSKDDVEMFMAAASQALGIDIDKMTDESAIDEVSKEYFSLSVDGSILYAETDSGLWLKTAVESTRQGKVPDMSMIDFKERMHVLQMIDALANVEVGKDLKHELVIEMDGITNGMIMLLLQIGTDEAMKFLEKGGVYFDSQFKGDNDIILEKEVKHMISKLRPDIMKPMLEILDECKGN